MSTLQQAELADKKEEEKEEKYKAQVNDRIRVDDDTNGTSKFGTIVHDEINQTEPNIVTVQYDDGYNDNIPNDDGYNLEDDDKEETQQSLTTQIATNNERNEDENKKMIQRINLKQVNHTILIKAWLACELRLDDFNIKNQAFSITGWINVFWKWDNPPKKLMHWKGDDIEGGTTDNDKNSGDYKSSEVIMYTLDGDEYIKLIDLRDSAITYYLPIDATKIFYCKSLRSIEHIEAPYLIYNKTTKLARISFYIHATLSEHLELSRFPFDRQFLNIKLRWNVNYYHIISWKTGNGEYNIPIEHEWFGKKGTAAAQRNIAAYHTYPLQVDIDEELDKEIKMYKPYIDFRVKKYIPENQPNDDNINLTPARFALIRLRVRRNPIIFCINVLIPFFIIVLCSFTVFAIPRDAIGERLGVSVTILLTFTAFQDMISNELPETSEMLWVDWYILGAYILQAILVGFLCLITGMEKSNDVDDDILNWVELGVACLLAAFWIIFSVGYYGKNMFTAFGFWRRAKKAELNGTEIKFWDEVDKQECKFWYKRGKKEISTWTHNTNMRRTFVTLQKISKLAEAHKSWYSIKKKK